MVTPMTEQSGRNEPSDRQGSDRPASDGAGSGRSANDRPRQARRVPTCSATCSAGSSGQAPGACARRYPVRYAGPSAAGSGPLRANVWDTATNEIPPDAGESPECQWCPICRAARRMRESGPGIGGQLSGAGDAVASAVQDAVERTRLDPGQGQRRLPHQRRLRTSGGSRASGGSTASDNSPASSARASWRGPESATTSKSGTSTERRPGFGDDWQAGTRPRTSTVTRRRRTGLPRATMDLAAGSQAIGWRLPRAPTTMRGRRQPTPDGGRRGRRPARRRVSDASGRGAGQPARRAGA